VNEYTDADYADEHRKRPREDGERPEAPARRERIRHMLTIPAQASFRNTRPAQASALPKVHQLSDEGARQK
jgi:hypothetical protein